MPLTANDNVRASVLRWLNDAVVGLNLCPFAREVLTGGRLTVTVYGGKDEELAIAAVLDAAAILLEDDRTGTVTTIVACPTVFDSFERYLDAVATVEDALESAGAAGQLQVASFHPRYVFADAERDDPANWSNRSPYALFHILREQDVSVAVDTHPNVHMIPERNIERLREMGTKELSALWARWSSRDDDVLAR